VKTLKYLLGLPRRFEALVNWSTEAQIQISRVAAQVERIAERQPGIEDRLQSMERYLAPLRPGVSCDGCVHYVQAAGAKYSSCVKPGGCINTCVFREPKP
jgi:hypothetical protein